MLYFVALFFVWAGVAGALIAGRMVAQGRAYEQRNRMRSPTEPEPLPSARGAVVKGLVVGGILSVAVTVLFSIGIVPNGHVGILYSFGQITGQRSSGIVFTAPWVNIETQSIQIETKHFRDKERLNTFSYETQNVYMDVTLNYSLSPANVQKLYREVGPNWFEKLVPSRVFNITKEETVRHTTEKIAPNREALRLAVKNRLEEALKPYSIHVEDFLIDNISFSPEFERAIEAKQIQTQKNQEEELKKVSEKAKADQQIEQARGRAESRVKEAEGEAEANRLISASLTPQVLQARSIEAIRSAQHTFLPANFDGILQLPQQQPAAR